ncbi:hypothetical protein CFC21_074758, partial [Triticum aestivum]|uniref:Uncharacterized protein n=4 Tax=Triticum aestivum TaxID=4565 RepID=A0A3B6LW22_WHEAT
VIGFSSQQHLADCAARREKGRGQENRGRRGGTESGGEREEAVSVLDLRGWCRWLGLEAGGRGRSDPRVAVQRRDSPELRPDRPSDSAARLCDGLWLLLLTGVMNSRPIVLVFLLLVLIISSQFEWKQQIGEAEASPEATRRRQQPLVVREDAVKEKIILAQEKNIQQLTELIQSLQVQLLHCRGSNSTAHGASSNQSSASYAEADRHQIIDD